MPIREWDKIIRVTVAISGLLVFIIAALAAIDGMWFNQTLFFGSWGADTHMAMPTAACFILVGSALILLGRPHRR